MSIQRAKELLAKYKEGTCTDAEKALVERWLFHFKDEDTGLSGEKIEQIVAEIGSRLPRPVTEGPVAEERVSVWPMAGRRISLRTRFAAAASIVLLLSVCTYWGVYRKGSAARIALETQTQDIAPGGNKAVLTLSDGRKISVTDAAIGKLTGERDVEIAKTADGQLVYGSAKDGGTGSAKEGNSGADLIYDTLTTPRGGQFQLRLADGSQVWLNAATAIRYPESFTGKERKIELIRGEVYLEVVHNDRMPFRVMTKGQLIEDVGTHFDIRAFEDELLTKTTLLEGGVMITKGNDKSILKPGQQAATAVGKSGIAIADVDTEGAIAWKNGYFLFDNESLENVMREISRWYDVDIEYPSGQKPAENYWGSITRFANISKVLSKLEITGDVRFKVVGRKIIVLRK